MQPKMISKPTNGENLQQKMNRSTNYHKKRNGINKFRQRLFIIDGIVMQTSTEGKWCSPIPNLYADEDTIRHFRLSVEHALCLWEVFLHWHSLYK
ncbi:uncharacterized protein LOC124367453 isoform X2 [Homalodisca vitripennis]|uniref:uncharacterized protein LOC124367453 isoform X2 n=1 Tax=Homalodisca vitripennis TaxID=197043 RepID=UPI001EEB6CBC|nr:uncharacterized protein LOC124367453 isoform X2 [Homalodisca vitripennis]